MKKYNRANKKWYIVGLVLPILLFFVTVNVAYAYFTAVASNRATANTPIIKISFQDGSSTVNSTPITGTTTLIPGDSISISGRVNNSGDKDIYAIITFKIQITKQNGATETAVSKYYSLENSKLREIKGSEGNFSKHAFTLATDETTSNFSVSHKFSFNKYNNSYKNALIHYELAADAIQKDGIDTNITATDLIMGEHKSSIKQLTGVSTQNGTPSPESPAEIKSVGEKTKNLLRYKGLTEIHKQLGDKTQPLTGLDEQQLYFGNGTGVFFPLPTAYGDGSIFEIKENYVRWSTATAYRGPAFSTEVKPNTEYQYSHKDANGNYVNNITITVIHYTSDGTLISSLNLKNATTTQYSTFTTPENAAFTIVNLRATNKGQVYTYYDLQLEEGNTVTPYEDFGYRIPISQQTKNLFDIDKITMATNYQGINTWYGKNYLKKENDVISVYMGANSDSLYLYDSTQYFSAGTTITISADVAIFKQDAVLNNNDIVFRIHKKGIGSGRFEQIVTLDSRETYYRKSATFTIPDDGEYLIGLLPFRGNAGSSHTDVRFKNIQIEKGSKATEYEPHIISTNIYLNEPLRSIGDVADYIDLETGTVVRKIGSKTFTGAETISIPTSKITGYTPFRYLEFNQLGKYPYICNYLPYSNKTYSTNNSECIAIYASGVNGQMFFIISNERIPLDDTTAFKQWLAELYNSGNPLKVNYILKTADTSETVDVPDLSWLDVDREFTIGTEIQPKLIYNY